MIDYETDIFDAVYREVIAAFPKVCMTSEYKRTPPSFPHVSLIEVDSSVYRRTQDSGSMENHALVVYEANVYSNKKNGKKTEAKAILDAVDAQMARLGFTRTYRRPMQNTNDATIYRVLARYRAVIDRDGRVYTR